MVPSHISHYLDGNLVRPRYEVVYGTTHVIKGDEGCRVHRVCGCVLEHVKAAGTLVQSPRKLPVQYHLHMTAKAGFVYEHSATLHISTSRRKED